MMMNQPDDDETEFFDDEESKEPRIQGFAQSIEEHFAGDDRFDSIRLHEPGDLEGEDFRLRFSVAVEAHFLVAVFSGDGFVRVGLGLDNQELNELIEDIVHESGDSLIECLESALEEGDELDCEVHQFEDDIFYFCMDVNYQTEKELSTEAFCERVTRLLEGFARAFTETLAARSKG